ncbi:hypothetical protein KY363_06970, partial [Candidatus Woesearchaeota archaeon]|nr:hypothetical protein [Candidatus Woesearchaeota archaeon]
MVKRGETNHKHRSGNRGGAKAAARPQHKARTKVKRVRVTGGSVLRAAESEFAREEKFIEKEARWLFGPQELHVTTFVLSLIILAFLLHSFSIIFYTVLTMGALLFAHFMRQHHRPHDVITIIGLFFLPLAFTLMAFRDWFSWLLAVVYTISVISTVIIYYYHKKVHSPLKIMWQVVYSKIIAITLSVILLCVLPYLFPDAFLSMFELIFVYVLPVAFVFFFASKFFYLYFFDRRHIRHDAAKSFKFAVIYALAFIVLCMCIYSLFAVGVYTSRTTAASKGFTDLLVGVDSVQRSMQKLPGDSASLRVMKDMGLFSDSLMADISLSKELVDSRQIALEDILSDDYMVLLVNDTLDRLRFVFLAEELVDAKAGAVESYGALSGLD